MGTPTPIGTPDWGTHTALIRETTINFNTAVHVGPGQTVTLGGAPTKTGYSVYLNMLNFSGVGLIPLEFAVTWLDSAGSNIIHRERWSMFAGTPANPHVVEGHGPCESGFMQIKATNHHSTDTCSFTLDIADVSQPYRLHDWRTDDTLAPVFTGLTYVTSDLIADVIGSVNQLNVPANSLANFVLPLYSGWATFHVDNAPTKSSAYDIINLADQLIAANFIYYRLAILPGGLYALNQQVCMPRGQCGFTVSNFDTAAMTANLALVAA